MDLVLERMARCGDRPRKQGKMDDGAQCDYMHAGNSYGSICGATREAEKGKANEVVSNVVSPALEAQNMAARDLERRDRIPKRKKRSMCKEGQSGHRLVDAGKWFMNLGCSGSALVDQSLGPAAVPSDLHHSFHVDPCERSINALHVAVDFSRFLPFDAL